MRVIRRTLRLGALSLALAVVLSGCGGASEGTYFPQPQPTTAGSPALPGEWVDFGTVHIKAEGTEPVTLLEATLVAPTGALEVDGLLMSRPDGGGIGIIREAELPADFDLEGHSRPLANAVLGTDTGIAQVVLRLKPTRPGRISASGVTLRFSVGDGAPQTETFPTSVFLCVAQPLPTSCE